jgi:hypothetical protein
VYRCRQPGFVFFFFFLISGRRHTFSEKFANALLCTTPEKQIIFTRNRFAGRYFRLLNAGHHVFVRNTIYFATRTLFPVVFLRNDNIIVSMKTVHYRVFPRVGRWKTVFIRPTPEKRATSLRAGNGNFSVTLFARVVPCFRHIRTAIKRVRIYRVHC